VLQGRRRAGKRTAPSDGHAHPVDARAQPGRGPAGTRQPPLGRRAGFPGGQKDRDGLHTAHHLRRVAADAAGQEVRQEERAEAVTEGLQRRLRRVHRPDRQQQFRHRHTAVRQFHVQRDPEVFAAVTGASASWFASHQPPPPRGRFQNFSGVEVH